MDSLAPVEAVGMGGQWLCAHACLVGFVVVVAAAVVVAVVVIVSVVVVDVVVVTVALFTLPLFSSLAYGQRPEGKLLQRCCIVATMTCKGWMAG